MRHMPTLATVMTPFPYAIDIDAPLEQARTMMTAHAIRHLPVIQGGTLVGVLTERDMLRSLEPHRPLQLPAACRVRDACVLDAYVVDLAERLDTVLLHMADQHIGSAIVVKHKKLVGIFTVTDACQAFGTYLRAQFPLDPDDDVVA